LARWEKPGLLAGLKLGGNARKISAVLGSLPAEIDAAAAKGQTWLQRVSAMRWSQAEILQIMEEIERVGAGTLQLYVAARHNLQFAYLRLLALANGAATAPYLSALNVALRPSGELVELRIARAVAELAQVAESEAQSRAFLQSQSLGQAPDGAGWEDRLPQGRFADGLRRFLTEHGHRCLGEGELMNPRWQEDPGPLLAAIAAAMGRGGLPAPSAPDEGPLLALVDAKRRKEAQALLSTARECLTLQSTALHVHAFTLAGTRIWALAAGREGMSDGRLPVADDVFFYELEETKEMMTGEWNISDLDGIRATAATRRQEWQDAREALAGDLLVGDGEAFATVAAPALGLPGAGGQAAGIVLDARTHSRPALPPGAAPGVGDKPILAAVQMDGGWAAALPVAGGILLEQGSPLDPLVAAAGALQVGVVYDLGQRLASLPLQQRVTIDGSKGTVSG
jgi:pyruvate,water dikinase